MQVLFWASQGLDLKLVSYGCRHGAAVDTKGGLWAWSDVTGPTPRKLPCRASLIALASTDSGLYAVTSRGKVLQWSDLAGSLADERLPLAEPSPMGGELGKISAKSIAAGADHVLVVGSRGEVVGFGDNSRGQLGLGDPTTKRADQPLRLPPLPAAATQVACGDAHSIVLLHNGGCVSFGDDRNLQLGLRNTTIKELRDGASTVHSPQPISLLRDRRVVAVRAGGGGLDGGHSAFLLDNGELWTCGYGRWGQLGGKAYSHISPPKCVATLAAFKEWNDEAQAVLPIKVVDFSCGERHMAAVVDCGSVFVWGWNQHGQLGTGTSGGTHTPCMLKSPPELRYDNSLRHVQCGPNSTLVWS